jgi:hypothetical protein
MTDEKDKGAGQRRPTATDSRQDRLKLALRENLKRRKSQARGRNDGTLPASHDEEAALHQGSKKPT